VGRICRKEGFKSGMKERAGDEKLIITSVFKSGMKERAGDEKLIITSVAVRGINVHIRYYKI